MARTTLILTAMWSLHIVIRFYSSMWNVWAIKREVSSLPIQDKMKLPSTYDNLSRSGTRRHRRSATPTSSFSIFLYARNTKQFVKVTPENITALGQKDKYAELIMTKRGFEGQVSIKGKHSNLYICMNSTGKVELKVTFISPECMFYNVPHHASGYITFMSAVNNSWYLGFKRRGTIKHGHRTEHDHRAAWLLMVNPDFRKK